MMQAKHPFTESEILPLIPRDLQPVNRVQHLDEKVSSDGGVLLLAPVSTESPLKLVNWLQHHRSQNHLFLLAPNPDEQHLTHRQGGRVFREGREWIHRPLQHYQDLAYQAGLYLHIPIIVRSSWLLLHFEADDDHLDNWRAKHRHSEPAHTREQLEEKYGATSDYQLFDRFQEPLLAAELDHALQRARLKPGDRVLSLGVNTARELDILREFRRGELYDRLEVTGLDLTATALAEAKRRHPGENFHFLQHDIRDLPDLKLPRQNLIMAISVFQTRGISQEPLLRYLIKQLAAPRSAFVIGVPASHYGKRRMYDGATTRHNARPDATVMVKDLYYLTRYFTRHGFRVSIGGRYYWLLIASSINSTEPVTGDPEHH